MSTLATTDFRPGDWVEVKEPLEIEPTLDANGALDGLPFMPEMLEHCGRRFRVLRRAEKTCLEITAGEYVVREFLHDDVFLLEGLRCPGTSHDGCQRGCMTFWKAAWLRRAESGESRSNELSGRERLLSRLKTMTAPGKYFCQSTELVRATSPKALTRFKILMKSYRELRCGAVGLLEMMRLIVVPGYRKARDAAIGRPRLVGSLSRTPVGSLGLQPGEVVEILSQEEMQKTLDRKGCNRGLVCDIELKKFCGTRDRVRNRLERMISEPTGQMRKVEGTVILEGNTCMCARVVGGCPRLEFCYWREVWLKRVNPAPESAPNPTAN